MLYPHSAHTGRPGPPVGYVPHPPRLVDVSALKQRYPIEDVVSRYGIDLRGGGRALVGHCPFHDDRRRPNLHVYPATASYFCYRCRFGGDVIDFVCRYERAGFRDAVTRLTSAPPTLPAVITGSRWSHRRRMVDGGVSHEAPEMPRDPTELACLAVAAGVYHARLLSNARATAYLAKRGIDLETERQCRLGYATGVDLTPALRARRLPLDAAERAGLMRDGREVLAGRIVVPEIRSGQPIWMVGRALATHPLRYLGLAGRKPLMGWDAALAASERGAAVVVVEGPFDWLPLVRWGVPAVTLVGTHARSGVVRQLARIALGAPLCLAFDADEPGVTACFELQDQLEALNRRAEPVWLPRVPGRRVKDVGGLAPLPGGRTLFLDALHRAVERATCRPQPVALSGVSPHFKPRSYAT